jgi:putative aldouronate transport system permease protein
VIDIYVYQTGISRTNYSYASAIGLFRSVISLLLLVGANTMSNRLQGASLF